MLKGTRKRLGLTTLDASVAIDPVSDDKTAIVTVGVFSEMFAADRPVDAPSPKRFCAAT